MVNALAATSQPTLKGVTCFASIMKFPEDKAPSPIAENTGKARGFVGNVIEMILKRLPAAHINASRRRQGFAF